VDLSEEDSIIVAEAIIDPPKPNRKLKELLKEEQQDNTVEGVGSKGGYRQEYCKIFYDLCCEGLFLATIAHKMGVSQENIKQWGESPAYKKFNTAYKRGMQACQAFHEELYQSMIKDKRCTAGAISQQREILRTRFKDDWSDNEQKIKIENTYDKMTDEDLQKQLLNMTAKPSARRVLESMLQDTKQEFKVISGGKKDSAD